MREDGLPFSLYPLDSRLVLPKPKNSVEDDVILALEKVGQAIFTRKRDGHCVTAVITDKPRLYTRGEQREISQNFPQIIKDLEKADIPKNTLLACELIMDRDGKDHREYVSSLAAESDPKAAIGRQRKDGRASLMVFNVLVHDSKDVTDLPNYNRLVMVYELFGERFPYVFPVEELIGTFKEVKERVLANGWEGVVIYGAREVSGYRLDGKTDSVPRPYGAWKWKPAFEDDFIVTGWTKGTKGKKHGHRMGKIALTQRHPVTGEEVLCGEVGIGFSDIERDEFANDSLYPFVAEIQYERRFAPRKLSKNRVQYALCSPRFIRRRHDKKAEECFLPECMTKP